MAILRIPNEERSIADPDEVSAYLSGIGIDYERWDTSSSPATDAPAEEILSAHSEDIERLKRAGGYLTADVIDVHAETPGLEAMLAKFSREHWHDDDEVRFIIRGHGLFHIRPRRGPVVAVEVAAGDLIRVPRETWHWFNICKDRNIRAIRLFRDPAGWTPVYTDSEMETKYEPVCLGPHYL